MGNNNKLAQDKLKLLYILKLINMPLCNSELSNYILEYNFMDYFTLQELLKELSSTKFLVVSSKDGKEYYSLSEFGALSLDMFGEILPPYFKQEVNDAFNSFKKDLKKKRELVSHYFKRKDEEEYVVSLQVLENERLMFSLSLNIATEELAKDICRRWDANADKVFLGILSNLTKDN